jgi:DNA-binding NarL/FixJ family response regulator
MTIALSTRELQIARLISQGKSNGIISQELGIAIKTVENTLHTIYIKERVSNRTQLAVKYLEVK